MQSYFIFVSCFYHALVMYKDIMTYLYVHREWVKAFTCIACKQEGKR